MRFVWGLAHLLQGRDRISPGAPTTYARHTPAVATPAWLMSHKNGPFYNFTTLRCMSPHNTTYAWLMAPKKPPSTISRQADCTSVRHRRATQRLNAWKKTHRRM